MIIAAAGGIVFDADGRILLVRRGREPGAGRWSVPGGRCEPGEPPAAACVREMAEETGLEVVVVRHAGTVTRPGLDGVSYRIDDYCCRVVGGRPVAGDDAAEVGWFDRTAFDRLPLVDGLASALRDWDLLPGSEQAAGAQLRGVGRPGCSPPRASR